MRAEKAKDPDERKRRVSIIACEANFDMTLLGGADGPAGQENDR